MSTGAPPPTTLAPTANEVWQVACGYPFTAALIAPPDSDLAGWPLGARVERPVTRAIVSAFQTATLSGGLYTVTLDGPVDPGSYNMVWMTTDENPTPTYEVFIPLVATLTIQDGTVPIVEWPVIDITQVTPTVEDVAALERTRTVDDTGNDIGEFTSATRPTDVECKELIDQARNDVLAQLRRAVDPVHYPQILHIVAYYAAMLVEVSYYREQTGQRAEEYATLFTQSLTNLQTQIERDVELAGLLGSMEPWQPSHRLERWQLL
jgi:hypothetical protein